MTIHDLGVVGLGTMGAGVLQLFASSGRPVVAYGRTKDSISKARATVSTSLDKLVAKGRLTQADADASLARITFTTHLDDLADVDLVLEATPEIFAVKRSMLASLCEVTRQHTILATNTSGLSVTELAASTDRPGNVVGMHFFNPATVLKLVEVVRTSEASDEAVDTVKQLALDLGKRPVVVEDRAGFVANHLLFGYLNRAGELLARGAGTMHDIDVAMRMGAGLPMGPFALMDLIGLDVCQEILTRLSDATDLSCDVTRAQLATLVAAGRTGRKAGAGYLQHTAGGAATPPTREDTRTIHIVGSGAERALPWAHAVAETVYEVEAGAEHLPSSDGDVLVVGADEVNSLPDGLKAAAVIVLDAPNARTAASATRSWETTVRGVLHAPTPHGQLLEVGTTTLTAERAQTRLRSLQGEGAGCAVALDSPGIIVGSLQLPLLNDATSMVQSGYATEEDVDTAMVYGCGYPAGPFATIARLTPARVATHLEALARAEGQARLQPTSYLLDRAAAEADGHSSPTTH